MPLPKITPIARKEILYSDFTKTLTTSPISNDLVVKKNEDSINESLRNLVLTERGERPMQPLLGCNVRSSLFDLMTPASLKIIEEQIRETIKNFEPRVELINVKVLGQFDENRVQVTITYYAQNSQEPIVLNIFLERVR